MKKAKTTFQEMKTKYKGVSKIAQHRSKFFWCIKGKNVVNLILIVNKSKN